jgi:hypothetical protein
MVHILCFIWGLNITALRGLKYLKYLELKTFGEFTERIQFSD